MPESPTISLANEAPFRIGPLLMIPAAYEIVHDDRRREALEPRVMEVLVLLARVDGAVVTRQALIDACWQGRIVGDDAINRVISRLRRVTQGIGEGVFHIETVSKIGYRLIRDSGDDNVPGHPTEPAKPAARMRILTPRRLTLVGVALVAAALLAIGLAGVWWQVRGPTELAQAAPSHPVPRLRIAPFARLSPEISPALVRAAQEEVVTAFGQTSLVDIVTGTAAVPDALDWTLTGAIDHVGANLRFTVHVTHDSTGKIVWSSAFERPAQDSSHALKSVAAAIQEIVASSLTAAASYRRGALPDSTAALMFQFNRDTTLPVGPYNHAEVELRKAVEQTPDFGAGWTTLALTLGYAATASDDPAAIAAARAEGPSVIAKALHYNPRDALALMARAKLVAPSDFLGREAAFLAATAAPTSEMGAEHSAYGVFLLNVGRIEDAVREMKTTYDLDPLASLFMSRYAKALGENGQTVLAASIINQTLMLWPDDVPTLALRIRCALWTAAYDDGIETIRHDPTLGAVLGAAMIEGMTALGSGSATRKQAAAKALARLTPNPAMQTPLLVVMLGALGDNAGAISAADRLIAAKGAMAAEVLFDPTLARARQTPQFAALVTRIGVVAYWRKSGHPPDFCRDAVKPALCATLAMPRR